MHELSIAMNLLEIIKQNASENKLRTVTQVVVHAGELAAVVPANLQFCFDQLKKDTIVATAVLVVEIIPLRAYCANCAGEFRIENFSFLCPSCGNPRIKVTSGEEICLYQLTGESL